MHPYLSTPPAPPDGHRHLGLLPGGEAEHLQADGLGDAPREHEVQAEAARGAGGARRHRRSEPQHNPLIHLNGPGWAGLVRLPAERFWVRTSTP